MNSKTHVLYDSPWNVSMPSNKIEITVVAIMRRIQMIMLINIHLSDME